MMCSTGDELRRMSHWDGKGTHSRQKLMEKLQGTLDLKRFYFAHHLKKILNSVIKIIS